MERTDARHEQLRETLHAAGVAAVLTGEVLRLQKRELTVVWRTAQPWAERLLEIITLHGLRTRSGVAQHTVVVIRLPHLPSGYAQVRDDQERLLGGRPGNWILMSDRGGFHVHLEAFGIDRAQLDARPTDGPNRTAAAVSARREPLRSDVTMTLLKALLARAAASKRYRGWWGGRLDAIQSVAGLAAELGCSASALYAVIGALRDREWVAVRHGAPPTIMDIPGVVTWWLDTQKHTQHHQVPVQPLYSTTPFATHAAILDFLAQAPTVTATWAVSGWWACALHEAMALTEASHKPVSVAIAGPITTVLRAWNLRPVGPGHQTGSCLLLESAALPKSTFCGMTTIGDLPVVDLWQAALDVASDPHRGIEQAEAIANELWLAQ
jgi:hypothetical protein